MEPDVYYHRMSGKYSLGDAVTATLVGAAIAIPLAFIYSYLILYIPFIYLNALFTLGFGIALGATAFGMLKWRKIRNPKVGTAIAFLVTAAGFYLSWAVWIYALFNRSDVDVALWPIVADPTGLWGVIQSVNEVGAWRFRSYTPTGAVLWGVWAIEAGLIFGIGVVIANHMFADTPFCEECGTWCEKKEGVAAFAADEPAPDADELKHRLEQKDFRLLEQLGPAAEGPGTAYQFDLESCPKCGETNTLDVKRITRTVDAKGKSETKSEDLIDNLLLTKADAEKIRELGQKALAPAGGATEG